jgi:hypothetical protein
MSDRHEIESQDMRPRVTAVHQISRGCDKSLHENCVPLTVYVENVT